MKDLFTEDIKEQGMTLIVKTVVQGLKGFIFLYGVYIVLYGHLTEGGGFAGGVIIASGFILVMLAFGRKYTLGKLGKLMAFKLYCLGALAFLGMASLAVFFHGRFFTNFLEKLWPSGNMALFSAGNIPLYQIAIGLSVAAGLFMVFIILAVIRVVFENGKGKLITTEKEDKKSRIR